MSRGSTLDFMQGQKGYTLLEMMISLLIGAVMIGAVLVAVSGSGLSGRSQGGQAQISEDGQIALNLIAAQLRMAGFWVPGSPVPSLHTQQPMLYGCRNGFSNPATANFAALACTAGTGNDSVAVRYDGREPGTVAADCLGAAVPAAGVTAGWVDNRFYIANSPAGNPSLFCWGNGGGNPQMLVENVETLQIRYGVAIPNPDAPATPELFDRNTYGGRTVRYVRANDLTADMSTDCRRDTPTANSWCGVTSVRICVVMRTAVSSDSASANTPFTNCDGGTTTLSDKRLRRAMVTTVSLRNRMP